MNKFIKIIIIGITVTFFLNNSFASSNHGQNKRLAANFNKNRFGVQKGTNRHHLQNINRANRALKVQKKKKEDEY